MAAASNLLMDNDIPALNQHLHTLVSQVKESTTVKMDILRLIVYNMQINKEITYEHAAVLLSLIQNEDGLVCSAYMAFERNDDLGALKDSLLRVLLLTIKPDIISPQVRLSAHSQQVRNRGSWRSTTEAFDISVVLEQLSRAEVLLYTLFELHILSEAQTSSLVRFLSEEPSQLQRFAKLTDVVGASLLDPSLYQPFLQQCEQRSSRTDHRLTDVLQAEYPAAQITEQLLKLEREGSLSKTEYAVLYRRSMDRSAVIRHCYDEFVKDHDLATLRKNLQLYLRVLEALRSPSAQISNSQHAAIIEELQRTEALSESELRWVIDEYCEGSEVVVNSFDVCVESKDVAGLASMLRKLMKMVESYQLRDEAKSFFETLFREMVESGVVSVAQSEILFELLQESSPVLVDLYGEYLRSQDFEGLLGALIVLCTLGGRREEGENDDGAQEGELEMEPWKISEEEIDRVLEEIGEKDLGMRRVAEELLDREDEEGISAVGLGEELDS